MSDLTIIRKPPRWFTWRDVVNLLLGVTVLLLAVQVNSLSKELSRRPTSEQFAVLTHQLEVKDARIKQLTDLLVRNRIPVPPAPVLVVPQVTPSPPGLSPSPGPSPDPQPGRSRSPRPRPTRSPSASPTPQCVVVLAGRCLNPPPTPTLPPLLP